LHGRYRRQIIHGPRIASLSEEFDIRWDETFTKQVIFVASLGKIGNCPLAASLPQRWFNRFGSIVNNDNILDFVG
jgi:hypothetical protein